MGPRGLPTPWTPDQELRPWTRPPFLCFAKEKGGIERRPYCARPSWPAAKKGSLRCSKPGPGQNSLRSPAARSAQTGWPSQKGCVPAARGPAFCAARRRRREGNSQQPIPTAGLRLADCWRVFVLAVWLFGCSGPHSPSAPPRSAAKGAVRRRRTSSSGSRSLFERSEPKASAASSARGPLGEHRREPLPAAGREGRAQCGVAARFPPFLWRSKEKGVGSRAEGPGRVQGEAPARSPGAKRPGIPAGDRGEAPWPPLGTAPIGFLPAGKIPRRILTNRDD